MIYPATDQYIELAKDIIENGNIIVYPTDTLYGFGVDATNTKSIERLNFLKGRHQPLSIIVSSLEQIKNLAYLNEIFDLEKNKIFPGPYTAILPSIQHNLSPLVQCGSPNIAIRIPDHFFSIKLVDLLGKPIITTSINRHGSEPLIDLNQVVIEFPNIDIFEDSNYIVSEGSTIINYSICPPKVIRYGDGVYPL